MVKCVTKESQYESLFSYPDTKLGFMANQVWQDDPKRLAIMLSRYKFVSKMLAGSHSVIEFGCADAFGSKLVAAEVEQLSVTDFDPLFVKIVTDYQYEWIQDCFVHDLINGATSNQYEAAYCLDVFEHIEQKYESRVLEHINGSLAANGVAIIGIPSLESQLYASAASKEGHVNCKSGDDFKYLLKQHFSNVFLFSMNDEVVHTGFYPMAHYLIALCVK